MADLLADPMSEGSFAMFDAYGKSKLAQLCSSFVMHRRERKEASLYTSICIYNIYIYRYI